MRPERNNIKQRCRVVTFLSNKYNAIVRTKEHWTLHCPEKQGEQGEIRGQATAHTAFSEFAAVQTDTCIFAREGLETRKALIDAGATRFMGSWESLDGLTRMNEQRHGSTRFFFDRTSKRNFSVANGERQQVTFRVNAGDQTSNCKITCLKTSRVSILLSVQSLSQMGAVIDFSTGTAFSKMPQSNGLCNWKEKHMYMFICSWWERYFHKSAWTKISCWNFKQRH